MALGEQERGHPCSHFVWSEAHSSVSPISAQATKTKAIYPRFRPDTSPSLHSVCQLTHSTLLLSLVWTLLLKALELACLLACLLAFILSFFLFLFDTSSKHYRQNSNLVLILETFPSKESLGKLVNAEDRCAPSKAGSLVLSFLISL